MPEPTALIIAAVGGAAVKTLIERTWSSGEKLLDRYFRDHQPVAIEKARSNAQEFWKNLAEKVARLEEQQTIDREVINRALDDPSFGAMLNNALINSAQTESASKHELLARLIVGRFHTTGETMLGAASGLACIAVASLTSSQITALAFQTALRFAAPQFSDEPQSEQAFLEECDRRLAELMKPFGEVSVSHADHMHMVALGCSNFQSFFLGDQSTPWKMGIFTLNWKKLKQFASFRVLMEHWTSTLNHFIPTPTGELIGLCALQAAGATGLRQPTWIAGAEPAGIRSK